jgi:hypothetical protein
MEYRKWKGREREKFPPTFTRISMQFDSSKKSAIQKPAQTSSRSHQRSSQK